MSIFSPSAEFNTRWLNSPSVIKNTIRQELTDIVHFLQEDTPLPFEFKHGNLNDILAPLQVQHLAQQKAQIYAQKQAEADILLPKLEAQVDNLLAEKKEELHRELTIFSDNIKAWLKETLDAEVSQYKP